MKGPKRKPKPPATPDSPVQVETKSDEEIKAFWTEQRRKDAQPVPMPTLPKAPDPDCDSKKK